MKNEFVNFINELIKANEELANSLMTPAIENYLASLKEQEEKPELTDNGKLILEYLQRYDMGTLHKAKDIADGLFISSRSVSGAMRKLVTDNFVEKIGKNPSIYILTEKGKNYILKEKMNNEI